MSFEVHSQHHDAATESRQNIRLLGTECQSLFSEEVINNISISTCIRRAEHRFLLWASFLGVYADEKQCLDIRLQNSPEMRNLILLMLRVLKRNLEHVIAEPYEIPNDDRKGPVYGIDGALDRLHRLATIIQSEQTINKTRKFHRLNSKWISDDLGETVMTFMQNHFPEAPLSLQQQLSRSVLHRTNRLLYSRQQLRATGQSNLSNQIPIVNLEAEAGSADPLHTYAPELSASLNKRATKLHRNTYQEVPSTSQGLSLYPDPPSLDGGDGEVLCKHCSALLDKATIGSQEAWAKHVDHDLRPYVCVSEECGQAGLMFPTPTDWRFHMEAVHSMEWPRYVHQARWTCPYCQQDSVERTFASAEEFSRHLREGNTSPHCLSVGSFELTRLTVECKWYEPIDKGDCPLCNSYMKVGGPDEVEDFYNHFIQHLRFVAFKAINMWDTQTVAELKHYASTDDAERQHDKLSDDEDKIQVDTPSLDFQNDTLSDRFRAEMDRVSIRGVDGKDQAVPYVPLSALEKYWTDERIIEILKTRAIQIPEGARFINQGYLRVFSTLVYSGFCDKISWFFHRNTSKVDDHDLPFDGNTFEHTGKWFSSFLEHQWMFCPVELTDGYCHQQALDLRVILPVTYGEYVKAHRTVPNGAILRKVDFNSGSESYLLMGERVMFKVYEGDEGEVRYNTETDAYIRLQKFSNNSIANYFASFHFREAKKFVIVLEYAEGGSLTDYLEANLPPTTPEDALLLWEPIFKLTEGLDLLTSIYQQNPRSQSFVGVHKEINPDSILVFPRGKGTSRFDVQFKFKDFGMAASGAMPASDRRLRLGNKRNRDYVSPEVFNSAIHGNSVAAISRLADIWSLGALFSDIFIWTITGTSGQEGYRLERKAEISQHQQFSNAGYDCCFHDGEKRLEAINRVHQEALDCRGNDDSISPVISDLILDHMLVEPRDRLDATKISNYAAHKLKEYQETLHARSPTREPSDIDLPGPLHPHAQGIQANMQPFSHAKFNIEQHLMWPRPWNPLSQEDKVTVETVYQLITSKDSKPLVNRLFGAGPSISDIIMDLPGMEQAYRYITSSHGRRQIILFDNSASMQIHREKAIQTARVISYVVKQGGPGQMEVYAASNTPAPPIRCKNSSEVDTALRKFNTVQGECRLRRCLDDVLDRILTRDGFQHTSIYILTDGAWRRVDEQGVKFAISRAINFLITHQWPSNALAFQFVQFGNNLEGGARMGRLDDECAKHTSTEMYHIVGHVHCDSHVPEIIFGAVSPYNDSI